MKSHKEIWRGYYEEALGKGLDEGDAADLAAEQTQDYLDRYGDYLHEKWKDRMMDDMSVSGTGGRR